MLLPDKSREAVHPTPITTVLNFPSVEKKSRGQKTKNSQPEFLVIISRFTSI